MAMIFNSAFPMDFQNSLIDIERVEVTTDSSGAATTTVSFEEAIDYSGGRSWGFFVEADEFCDTKWGNTGADTVDVSIQNAPADSTVRIAVLRAAERSTTTDPNHHIS